MRLKAEGRRQKAEGSWLFSAFCLLVSAFAAPAALACPVCYGAPGPTTTGLNNAIIFLLVIVGLVQVGFIALFWSFRKRAKELQRHRESFHVIEGGV